MPEVQKYFSGNISLVLKPSLSGNRTAENGEMLAAGANCVGCAVELHLSEKLGVPEIKWQDRFLA